MEIVHQTEAVEVKPNKACSVMEYRMQENEINGAKVILKGRYPDTGWVKNLQCKEMAYVIQGTGKLVIEGKEFLLSSGDLVLIHPNEKYYWYGDMILFVPSVPAWTLDQHQQLP